MIIIWLMISCFMAIILNFTSAKVINAVEVDVLETAKSIENGVTRRVLPLWLIIIYMVTTTYIAYLINNEYIFLLTMIIISIASIIDIIRNWIPDLLIFVTVALSFMGTSNEHSVIIISCIIALSPLFIINLISFKKNNTTAIAAGDLYIIATLSLWLTPLTSLTLSALIIISTTFFSFVSKVINIPLVPFIHFSFLLTFAVQHNLL